MTFGRKILTAAAAVLAVAAMTGASLAQAPKEKASKGPVVYSPEVNMCRASCGDAWVKARVCDNEAAVCLRRADRAYKQCLPDCDDGKSPMTGAFAYMAPKQAPAAAPSAAAAVAPASVAQAPVKPQDNGPDSTAAVPWVDARTQWEALPAHTPAPLPATFPLPTAAYGYAGFSQPIRPFVLQAPGLLKVEVVVSAGQVGVALATPDGSALVSKEAALKPSAQRQTVYFQIGPETPPVSLLVRNYDPGGAPGSVTVRAVTFARSKVLPAGEAMRLGALK